MRKTLFLAALVFISMSCAAQKKNISKARNLAMSETPDYTAARQVIDEALHNDETKNLAETWYTAGLIGYQQNQAEHLKRQLGQSADEAVLANSIMESYGYWLKADEIAMTPVYDKKGKAKYDTKTRKNIGEKMVEYYLSQDLVQYGVTLNDQREYKKAYDMFLVHLGIPKLEMFKDEKLKKLAEEKLVMDTTYNLYEYYAARFAYAAQMYDEAIAIFARLKDGQTEQVSSAEFLYQCYIDKGDSATANKVLDECIDKFPKEEWFMQNRINNLVNNGQEDEAIAYLDKAIERNPNVGQYYNSKGSILSLQKKFEEAFVAFEKAITLEPDNALFQESYGFAYVDMANMMNDEATYLDAKAYRAKKVEIDATNRKALPYFEKAYQLDPENPTYKRSLRSLYYRLGMEQEYNNLQ